MYIHTLSYVACEKKKTPKNSALVLAGSPYVPYENSVKGMGTLTTILHSMGVLEKGVPFYGIS